MTDDFEHSEFNCKVNSNKNWKFTFLLALPILGRVTATVVVPITQACNSLSVCVGSLMSHRFYMFKGCEMGPLVYYPYPRRVENLTICRCLYKDSALNRWPPTWQPSAYPIKLIGQWLIMQCDRTSCWENQIQKAVHIQRKDLLECLLKKNFVHPCWECPCSGSVPEVIFGTVVFFSGVEMDLW